MKLTVCKIGNSQTVSFAVKELIRLIKEMDSTVILDVRKYASYDESVKDALWVGLGFTEESENDSIAINVKDGVGFISGSNERSVLISAYRFMKEMGCCYLYPGKEGEVIPSKKLSEEDLNVKINETASYNYRGICIEGTVGYEHVYNMIDWLPKVGMNEYFFQFLTPATFFNNFYKHFTDQLDDSAIDGMVSALDEEIIKRGLKYQAVGHGWTCVSVGLSASGWDKYEGELSEENKSMLAMRDGERKLNNDIPLNTNLCYSNPTVRTKMVDYVVEYCKNNKHKDHIAFWMADGGNNHCECENCKKKIPSDFLVMMLNELDEKLTQNGLDTKINILPVYNDSRWDSKIKKIKNPQRFALYFAPIFRSYTVSYADYDFSEEIEIEPYVRNKNVFKYSLPKAVAMFKKWQKEQQLKDVMLFDYHLMWDHHYDPGYYEVAQILQKDMASLDKIGLDGMISCQLQRIAFPTNLPMYSMAKTLWNKNETFKDIAKEYYFAAYGEYADAVEEYMSTLSGLFVPEVLRGEKPYVAKEMTERYEKAKQVIEEFKINYILKLQDTSKLWKYLFHHAELVKIYADAYIARFNGKEDECKAKAKEFYDYVNSIKTFTDTVLDDNFLRGDVSNNLFGWRKTI